MNTGKYIFSQVLSFVDKYEFNKCVKRYFGNYHIRDLNCWHQFVQLLFGQLTSLKSLRDICLCLKAHQNKLYHLGINQFVVHTTLSRANEKRDWRIFADFGNYLIKVVRPMYSDCPIPNINLDNEIFCWIQRPFRAVLIFAFGQKASTAAVQSKCTQCLI